MKYLYIMMFCGVGLFACGDKDSDKKPQPSQDEVKDKSMDLLEEAGDLAANYCVCLETADTEEDCASAHDEVSKTLDEAYNVMIDLDEETYEKYNEGGEAVMDAISNCRDAFIDKMFDSMSDEELDSLIELEDSLANDIEAQSEL